MKINCTKNDKVSITGLTMDELSMIQSVLYSAKRCFPDREDNGEWLSNDDFVCTLNEEEKKALDQIEL